MSNQIKLTIDLSDDLLDKVLTVIALSGARNPMQAMMMGMGATPLPTDKKGKERQSMGFNLGENDVEQKTKEKKQQTTPKGA